MRNVRVMDDGLHASTQQLHCLEVRQLRAAYSNEDQSTSCFRMFVGKSTVTLQLGRAKLDRPRTFLKMPSG